MGQAGRRHRTGGRNACPVIQWIRNRGKQPRNIGSLTASALAQPCIRPTSQYDTGTRPVSPPTPPRDGDAPR